MPRGVRKTQQEQIALIDQQIADIKAKKDLVIQRHDSKLADLAKQKLKCQRKGRQKEINAIAEYIDDKQIDLKTLRELFSQLALTKFTIDQLFSLMSSLVKHKRTPESIIYLLSQLDKMNCSVDLAYKIIQNTPKEAFIEASGQ